LTDVIYSFYNSTPSTQSSASSSPSSLIKKNLDLSIMLMNLKINLISSSHHLSQQMLKSSCCLHLACRSYQTITHLLQRLCRYLLCLLPFLRLHSRRDHPALHLCLLPPPISPLSHHLLSPPATRIEVISNTYRFPSLLFSLLYLFLSSLSLP